MNDLALIDDKDVMIAELLEFIYDYSDFSFLCGEKYAAGTIHGVPVVIRIERTRLCYTIVESCNQFIIEEMMRERFAEWPEIHAVIEDGVIELHHV